MISGGRSHSVILFKGEFIVHPDNGTLDSQDGPDLCGSLANPLQALLAIELQLTNQSCYSQAFSGLV
nr:hypothetical transcript [Hymenolepis microstoma]